MRDLCRAQPIYFLTYAHPPERQLGLGGRITPLFGFAHLRENVGVFIQEGLFSQAF